MANFPLNIPALGSKFVDYRQQIPGDSFNWSWIRPLSSVQYLTIHHTAGPDTQTPEQIANYHIQNNGWGGVGYHFLIAKNGTVYYVGDINTARANVKDLNDKVIGICLIGSFIGGVEPSLEQINSTHLLCAKLLFETPEIPNVNGWEDMVGHKNLNQTACPGDTWDNWRGKIIGSVGPVPKPEQTKAADISQLYKIVLGREPDQAGLQYWMTSNQSLDAIRKNMVESAEHQQLIARAKNCKDNSGVLNEITAALGQWYAKLRNL